MVSDPRVQVVCISDTHNANGKIRVPWGQLLVHAGDLTERGTVPELRAALRWLNALPHRHKVLVPGNHDWMFAVKPWDALRVVGEECPGLDVLMDEGRFYPDLGGLQVWGSPWVLPWRQIRNFYTDEAGVAKALRLCPDNVDVLVTHQPPLGILDVVAPYDARAGRPRGSSALLQAVFDIQPRLHVFGHLHLGYGKARHRDYGLGVNTPTTFVNAAQCCGLFGGPPYNEPVVVRLEKGGG